jgi:hypothetical protein
LSACTSSAGGRHDSDAAAFPGAAAAAIAVVSEASQSGRQAQRRLCLRLAGASAALLLAGHSPYRQWDVYRKSRLVLLVSASDTAAVRLAEVLAAIFARRLPESRATFARARDTNDLVRLVASRQLEVALLRESDAFAAYSGKAPFADNGGVALRTLAALGEHLFVCIDEIPAAAANMLVETLAETWYEIDRTLVQGAGGPKPSPSVRVPLHRGAMEFYREHT